MRTGTTGQDGVRADDVRDDALIGAQLARAASVRIEDYAIVGDTQTIALVGIDGSIDWLCLPRFDSGACFAALLGDASHGRWQIAPAGGVRRTRRRYRGDTLVLETEMETADGVVRVVDSMPIRGKYPDVVRVVEGVSGSVPMRSELVVRFDYGSIVPWVRKIDGRLHAIAGPDALVLTTPVRTHGERFTTVAQFTVHAGERVPFVLTWHPSYEAAPESAEPFSAIDETEAWWREWASRNEDAGTYRDATLRSLITLKALTYAPSGGIVAAGTTSLPERLGGSRNWDYRFCWLRDATLTLYALLGAGFREEAIAWRDWLLRSVAGDPSKLQIMYGVIGDRRLDEREVDWLPGYEGSRPVRTGNAAWSQFQLDVYGEVLDTFHQARRMGVGADAASWALQLAICESLERDWRRPDEGFWEIRDSERHFTYSKVMAWVARDRSIDGAPSERRSIATSAAAATTRSSAASPSRTVRSPSTRRSCGSRPSASSPSATSECSGRSPRSRGLSCATASSPGITRRRDGTSTASQARRGRSSRARSGSSTHTCSRDDAKRRCGCSSVSSPSGTTSGCSRRSTTSRADGSSATIRRRSRTSRSSTARATSRALADRPITEHRHDAACALATRREPYAPTRRPRSRRRVSCTRRRGR